MEIREALPAEYEAVGELTVLAYTSVPTGTVSEMYRPHLLDAEGRSRDATLLVAVDGGELLGTVTYVGGRGPLAEFEEEDAAGVRMLAVTPEAQGRGIGEALLRDCIERARAEGRRLVVLHTIDWMQSAIRLFERLGFRRVPERDFSLRPDVDLQGYELEL